MGLLVPSALTVLLALTNAAALAAAAKVLVTVPGIAGSNNHIMYRTADLLASRQMDVTVFKYDIVLTARTPKIKLAKEISIQPMRDLEKQKRLKTMMDMMPWENLSKMEMVSQMTIMQDCLLDACQGILTDMKLMERLKAEKFDVVVIHIADICGFGLMQMLGIRSYVWFTTAFMIDPMAWLSGSPNPPSYVPSAVTENLPIMSFRERATNAFVSAVTLAVFRYNVVAKYTNLFRAELGQDFPDVFDIMRNTSLYFLNSDIFYDYPRPTMANVVSIGGLTMVEPTPLTEEWQKIVDTSRKNGVILFSLGSVVNTNMMPESIRAAFLNAFKRFPDYTVVWKYDGNADDLKSAPNVIASQWVPQKDLLVSPKVRLFITHGGFNSLTEAGAAGVPLVVLPLFGDQPANAKRYEWFKTAASLDKTNLTEVNIVNAISAVLSDPEYGHRARRHAKMIKMKPLNSLDAMVSWLQFLAEFKTLDILQPYGNQLSLAEYFLFDVVLAVALVVILTFGLTSAGCWLCCRWCCRRKAKPMATKPIQSSTGVKSKQKTTKSGKTD